MNEPKKTPQQLFDEHWDWFESIAKHIARDWFIHGYKHGRKDRQHDVRTRISKK